MNHDPLCYMSEGKWDGGCQCEFIQRIRLDILTDKYYEDIVELENAYDAGYKDALKDCNTTFEEYRAQRKEWNNLIDLINNTSRKSHES